MAAFRGMLLCSHTIAPGRMSRRYSSSLRRHEVVCSTDLRSWVRSQGGFVWSGLHVAHSGAAQGMELIATQELPKGSTIITLPRKVPMPMPDHRKSSSPADTVICEVAQRVPGMELAEELWAMRLGLKLLSERAQKGSYWWPYISMLPQTFTLPMFFTGMDIENIDYVPVTYQVKKRCKFLLQFCSELSRVLESVAKESHPFGGQTIDAGALGWAMAAVSSRAFKVRGVDNELCAGMMLPLIDMCNHCSQPNARIVEDLSKEAQDVSFLQVITEQDLTKGTPVTINYGPLSNDMLLLDYGFVLPDNPYDRIELRYDGALMENARLIAGLDKTGSPPLSSPTSRQSDLLSQLGLLEPGELQKVTFGGPEHVDGRLLAALRILYADESQLGALKDPVSLQSWKLTSVLSTENEQRVQRTLCALGLIVLNQFKTTVAEDEAQLADRGLGDNSRIAIQFRLAKKKLMLRALEFLKGKLKDLHVARV